MAANVITSQHSRYGLHRVVVLFCFTGASEGCLDVSDGSGWRLQLVVADVIECGH